MTPEEQKKINFRRKINARATAFRTVGKSDDQALDAILQFNDVPESMKNRIKQAKAAGQSTAALDEILSVSSQTPKDSLVNTDNFETKGMVGSVGRFLGIDKIGRYAGAKLAMLDPQHRANLAGLSEEDRNAISSSGVSGKEALGSAGNLALNLAGGSILRGAGAVLGVPGRILNAGRIAGKARTLTPAVLAAKPVATLAKGAALGYAGDVAGSMNDNESVGDILAPGVGTGVGAAFGAIPGVRNLVKGTGLAGDKVQKEANKLLKMVAPDLKDVSAKEYKELVSQGRVKPRTATQPAQYIMSDKEIAATMRHSDLIDKDPLKTSLNINQRLGELDSQVGEFLNQNNSSFNVKELTGAIKSGMSHVSDVSVPEERITATKDQMIKNFMETLPGKDMYSLWNARKQFDQNIEAAFRGSPSLQKEIKKAFRNSVQDFISSKTPNQTYKQYMGDMTSLFNIQDLTKTSAAKERGLSATGNWLRDNPNKARVLGYGGLVGLGAVGGALGLRSLGGGDSNGMTN